VLEQDKLKFGSGVEVFSYDLKNKYYSVEFDLLDNEISLESGINLKPERSFMNPSSTLSFIANGYYMNYMLIKDEIESLFLKSEKHKKIPYLIFPLFYSYRHFVELKLKSVYISIVRKKPKINHDLLSLVKKIKSEIKSDIHITESSTFSNQIYAVLDLLIKDFNEFAEVEPKPDFYRYYFDIKLNIDKYKVELDFDKHIKLLKRITSNMSDLLKLSRIYSENEN